MRLPSYPATDEDNKGTSKIRFSLRRWGVWNHHLSSRGSTSARATPTISASFISCETRRCIYVSICSLRKQANKRPCEQSLSRFPTTIKPIYPVPRESCGCSRASSPPPGAPIEDPQSCHAVNRVCGEVALVRGGRSLGVENAQWRQGSRLSRGDSEAQKRATVTLLSSALLTLLHVVEVRARRCREVDGQVAS